MADYKLPRCWLGNYRNILSENATESARITEDQVNMNCRCANEMFAFFCEYGHLTECHVGMSCEEAECSHYEESEIEFGPFDGEDDIP